MLASFCDVATNSNPEETHHKQTLDDLNRFMEMHRMPREMQIRLREYFHQRKHVQRAHTNLEVIHKMSTSLQVPATPRPLRHPLSLAAAR